MRQSIAHALLFFLIIPALATDGCGGPRSPDSHLVVSTSAVAHGGNKDGPSVPDRGQTLSASASVQEEENARYESVRVLIDKSRWGGASFGTRPVSLMTEAFGWTIQELKGDPVWRVTSRLVRPPEITRSLLDRYDFVIRVSEFNPRLGEMRTYLPSEIQAYRSWVAAGGRLLLLCDYVHSARVPLELPRAFGIIVRGAASGRVDRFAEHPMNGGMSTAYMHGFGAVAEWPPEATILAWASKDIEWSGAAEFGKLWQQEGAPVFGFLPYGNGMIVFLTDANAFYGVRSPDFPDPFTSNVLLWSALGEIPGHIEGRVVNRGDGPVSGAEVDILQVGGDQEDDVVRSRTTGTMDSGVRFHFLTTDSEDAIGKFHSGPLAPGKYDVRAFHPGRGYNTLRRVEISAESPSPVEIPIPSMPGAEIRSTRHAYHYGRYLARIQAPERTEMPTGTCTGFFTYYEDPDTGAVEEIDVELLSYDPYNVHFTVHWGRQGKDKGSWTEAVLVPQGIDRGYHEYGFEWFADRVEFFVDPKKNRDKRWICRKTDDPERIIRIPTHKTMLLMNHWTGNTWAGEPLESDARLPVGASVDLVDYQPADGMGQSAQGFPDSFESFWSPWSDDLSPKSGLWVKEKRVSGPSHTGPLLPQNVSTTAGHLSLRVGPHVAWPRFPFAPE